MRLLLMLAIMILAAALLPARAEQYACNSDGDLFTCSPQSAQGQFTDDELCDEEYALAMATNDARNKLGLVMADLDNWTCGPCQWQGCDPAVHQGPTGMYQETPDWDEETCTATVIITIDGQYRAHCEHCLVSPGQ